MAIIGKVNDVLKWNILSDRLQKALRYLQNNNLNEIFKRIEKGPSKVIELDGDNLFAIFSKYVTNMHASP